jgi:hypothetical protein
MDGESTIAAKTRLRKRAGQRRSTAEMAPPASEMPAAEMASAAAEMPAAKVPSAMAATMKMPATVTTAVAATMSAAATFGEGIACGRQRGRENNNGNSNPEF